MRPSQRPGPVRPRERRVASEAQRRLLLSLEPKVARPPPPSHRPDEVDGDRPRVLVPDRYRLFHNDDGPGPPRGRHVRASISKFCRFVIGPTFTKVETLWARMIRTNI